jgi:hypothetical protein
MPFSSARYLAARLLPGGGAAQRGHGHRPAMNSQPATCVLADMRTHRSERGARRGRGQDDNITNTRVRRWRPRRSRDRDPAGPAAPAGPDGGQSAPGALQPAPGALQQAIGLLTASLDSPELETWAVWALIPEDPAALGDFIAGLHVISQLLLHELHAATGRSPADTLQRLAILAETLGATPSAG